MLRVFLLSLAVSVNGFASYSTTEESCVGVNQWVDNTIEGPIRRAGGAATVVGSALYIHGGEGEGFPIVERTYSDLWMYEDGAWTEIAATGDIPSNRTSHSMVSYGGWLVVYGGFSSIPRTQPDPMHTSFDDLYFLDMQTSVWTKIDGTNAPKKRGDHGAVVVGDSMYVFGGFETFNFTINDAEGSYDEMWRYSFAGNSWELMESVDGPGARYGFVMSLVETKFYFFTGACASDDAKNVLDVNRNAYGECIDEWSYDTATNEWTFLNVTTQKPIFRRSVVTTDVTIDGVIYGFGGVSVAGFGVLSDLFAFDTVSQTYHTFAPNFNRGPAPPLTTGGILKAIDDKLVLFSGRTFPYPDGFSPGTYQLYKYTPIPVV